MAEIADNLTGDPVVKTDTDALDARVFRVMIFAVSVTVVGSVLFAPGRITTGLLLGGLLSLLNHHWLRTSIAAALNPEAAVLKRPRVKISRFILRYFVVAGVVWAAYQLGFVSLPATLIGLCSFVVALLAEAVRCFYLILIRREESY